MFKFIQRNYASIPQPHLNIIPKYTGIFINNEWLKSHNNKSFPAINPSTEEEICLIEEASKEDIDQAVNAARDAFAIKSVWRKYDANHRSFLLNKLADLIERDRSYLASLETLDNGKPYTVSYNVDLPLTIQCYRYFAGWADKIHGRTIPISGNFMCMTRKEPVGVCAQIIPWNFPLLMQAWKLGPALAAGNTIVLKPAEQTSLTALYVAELTAEAGFPPGVINVVPGFGPTTGALLAQHPYVDKVAFTGSTDVGREILKYSGSNQELKRVSLELGGKSPNIIFADCHDIDQAVEQSHFALFFNQGQCCCAGSRTFVEDKIYDEFVHKSQQRALNRKMGDPFHPETEHGPQINKEQADKIVSFVKSGLSQGARLLTSKADEYFNFKPAKGYFVKPAVFSEVHDHMDIAQHEIFGPVQQIFRFKDMDEIIERANKTIYGLAAAVYTRDINKALTLAQAIRAGTIWINCFDVFDAAAPFGGFKQSGIGRELGEDGLSQYLETKTITIKIPEKIS